MPADRTMKVMNAVHRFVISVTGGRWGWDLQGMPVVTLTTTGRKSGQPRESMLTSPATANGSLVVVASRGGDDRHPAWFLNLRDDPRVLVAVKGGTAEPRLARVIEGDEREQLWAQIAASHAQYRQYQTKTSRVIPLVALDPVPA